MTADCILCLMNRQLKAVSDRDEKEKEIYIKKVMNIILGADDVESAPVLVERMNLLQQEMFGESESYEEEKTFYNEMMLQEEARLEGFINEAYKPLYRALLLARAGNYIDFGALKSVDTRQLEQLLNQAVNESLPEKTYKEFIEDLAHATKLTYLTDNCGEVVLDKLLIRQIQSAYPDLKITVIVRGRPVLNDVTMKEAKEVGLTELVQVIDNGSGIGGTWPPAMSEEARRVLDEADVIVAKGQGNFETLHGCGRNIYYAFLCKCQLFTQKFGLEQLAGVFVRDCEVR